eukprot:361758-Chlamydomonas_euryale.AAC.2
MVSAYSQRLCTRSCAHSQPWANTQRTHARRQRATHSELAAVQRPIDAVRDKGIDGRRDIRIGVIKAARACRHVESRQHNEAAVHSVKAPGAATGRQNMSRAF